MAVLLVLRVQSGGVSRNPNAFFVDFVYCPLGEGGWFLVTTPTTIRWREWGETIEWKRVQAWWRTWLSKMVISVFIVLYSPQNSNQSMFVVFIYVWTNAGCTHFCDLFKDISDVHPAKPSSDDPRTDIQKTSSKEEVPLSPGLPDFRFRNCAVTPERGIRCTPTSLNTFYKSHKSDVTCTWWP